MRIMGLGFLCICLAALLFIHDRAFGAEGDKFDWRSDWELENGLEMEIDSKGFKFPVQTVFVSQPGTGPKDPLYFVIELKGTVKVVTNDRSVYTFAAGFLPRPQGETFVPTGAAGLCLDPENGYIFATFAYQDNTNIYRNGIARFTSQPGKFSLKAKETEIYVNLFKDEIAGGGHTIGPCQIRDGLFYVTVGYGQEKTSPLDLQQTNGKILRMTLDFKPVQDNPFYRDDGKDEAVDYVWAYGFSNPFGLKMVGDRLFATENGGGVDRFNEIFKGESYLWDGTDWSMGARATQAFSPAIGIVHLDYIPPDNTLFPADYRNSFVAAAAGAPGPGGPSVDGRRTVLIWQYDFENRRVASVPRPILRYRGSGMQLPVSVALGPDGLYLTPLMPNEEGLSAIFRIIHDTAASYPHLIGGGKSASALIVQYRCRQCHIIASKGGRAGPPLDSMLLSRLTTKLNDPDYANRVAKVDKIESEPFANFRNERADILSLSGEERVKRWLPMYLREPKFDNPDVAMPSLGLNEADAQQIAQYLIETTTTKPEAKKFSTLDHIRFALSRYIPDLRYRHIVFSFILGALLATVGFLLIGVMRGRRRAP